MAENETLPLELESFVRELVGEAEDRLPGYKLVCALVRPNGQFGVAHNLIGQRSEAISILRAVADRMERTAGRWAN